MKNIQKNYYEILGKYFNDIILIIQCAGKIFLINVGLEYRVKSRGKQD